MSEPNKEITTHCFSIKDALAHGVEKAVLLYNIRFWLEKNLMNEHNIKDGYAWTYNSGAAFAGIFPYFSLTSIKRWLSELEAAGVLKSCGEYNRSKFDKTKWYTIPAEYAVKPNESPIAQNGPSTARSGPTIPDVTPGINTNTPPTPNGADAEPACSGKNGGDCPPNPPEGGVSVKQLKELRDNLEFEVFWKAYPPRGVPPRKEGRKPARKAFGRAKRPPIDELLKVLSRHTAMWNEPRYIPHAATWLNQERWADELDVETKDTEVFL